MGFLSQQKLVGVFNPSEKYARQIGNLPQIGVKIKKKNELPPPSNILWHFLNQTHFLGEVDAEMSALFLRVQFPSHMFLMTHTLMMDQ